MAAQKILGTDKPVETRISQETSDREAAVVEVEGSYAAILKATPENYCPSGMTVESFSRASAGNGMGKLTVRCLKYDAGTAGFAAMRTTFRVDMLEVQYDLEDNPSLEAVRDDCLKWLATDESKRVDGNDYKYEDKDGTLVTITAEAAKKFCAAYMGGIKTFNRYYPVVEKISAWKNPPGLNRNGRSFTGGSPTFSTTIGKYDDPPITLNGYGTGHWFKSKDSWQENADKTWTRTEQWTYTPESSDGDHGWIYNGLNNSNT